jgi:hypothetical protein
MKMKALFSYLTASWLVLSSGQVFPAWATPERDGAKGLFFTQLDRPSENINTGVQYWIELHRNNSVTKVNNKTVFHTGDKIRFHIKPNIDGYAYILLRSGSRGEQAVLFPDPERKEENRLERGKDYVLPGDGELKFDQNPGIEKLSLLLSRTPIETKTYLSPQTDASSPPLVATIASGSKDLIPSQILVSYVQPSPLGKASIHSDADSSAVAAAKKPGIKSHSMRQEDLLRHRQKHNTVASSSSAHNPDSLLNAFESGITTVVYKDPSGVLAVDVSLEHE